MAIYIRIPKKLAFAVTIIAVSALHFEARADCRLTPEQVGEYIQTNIIGHNTDEARANNIKMMEALIKEADCQKAGAMIGEAMDMYEQKLKSDRLRAEKTENAS